MAKIIVLNQWNTTNGLKLPDAVVKVLDGNKTFVTLNQSSTIQLGLTPEQIASIEQVGNNAVITLKNGEVITLENYFSLSSQMILQDGTAAWQATVTPSATGQVVVDYLPVELEATSAATTALGTTAWYTLGAVALGAGVAVAASGNSGSKVSPDITAPAAGTLSFAALQDTGSSSTDRITSNNSFKLQLNGQEAGTRVDYQVSTDSGKTWTTTTLEQADLTDGQYQFRVKVSDAAGNSSFSDVQVITIDTSVPVAGHLTLTQYDDTGSLASDFIGHDNSFILQSSGHEAGSHIDYQVSVDGGLSWQVTTAEQVNLADGQYQFRTQVTDAAGNSSVGAAQAVTIDTTLNVSAVVISINPVTADNSINLAESGQTQTISGSITGLPANMSQSAITVSIGDKTYAAIVDPVTQQWSVEVPGSELFVGHEVVAQVTLTDHAGNTATVSAHQGYTINPVPEAPIDILATTTGFVGSEVNGSALPGSTIQVKDENGLVIATGTADDAGKFSIGIFESVQPGATLSITSTLNGYESVPGLATLIEVPFLTVFYLDANGLIEGFATDARVVKVMDDQNNVIQEHEVNGFYYSFVAFGFSLDQPLPEGSSIKVIAVNSHGVESRPYPIVTDYTAPAAASELGFDEPGRTLSGVAEAGAYVAVSITIPNSDVADFVGSGHVGADGKFSIVLDRPLHDGELVRVVVSDQNHNTSGEAFISASDYAPVPVISSIMPSGLVQGTAEANSLITIKNAQGTVIATTTANSEGNFAVQSSEVLSNNQQLQISAINSKGQSSATGSIVVDYAPPEPASNVSFNATGSMLSGKAEAGSLVELYLGNNQIGSTVALADGSFEIRFYNKLHNAETVRVVVIDQNQNHSQPLEVVAPDYVFKPTVSAKTGLDNLIEVQAEIGNQIIVRDAQGNSLPFEVVGQTSYGYQLIEIDASLMDGQQLSVYAVNARGHESKPTLTVVDYIAPEAPVNVTIDEQGHVISGTAAANAWVGVLDAQNNEAGFTQANSDGQFSIVLNSYYLKGQSLGVLVMDDAGNESRQVTVIAPVDATPPQAATGLLVQPDGRTLTGQAEANSYIRVYDSNAQIVGQGYADAQGNVTVSLNSVFLKGQTLNVTVFDRVDNRGMAASVITPNDISAPDSASGLAFSSDGKSISGQAEAHSSIQVYNQAGNQVASTTTDTNGNFSSFFYSNTYLKGEQLSVIVVDAAGNRAAPVTVTAPLDNTPPAAVTDLAFNSMGNILTGSAEIGSQIKVYDASNNQIYSSTWVDSNGQFSASLYNNYLNGQVLKVVVIDPAGNLSEAVGITAPLDNTPPDAASNVSFVNHGSALAGYAEAHSQVLVYDSKGSQIASGVTNSQGSFTVSLNGHYLQGQQLGVQVVDPAGNTSSTIALTAPLDTTAPVAPLNLMLRADGDGITGQAEAGSTVRVYDGNNRLLGSSQIYSDDGKFSIYLNNVSSLVGQQVMVTATDQAGNISAKTILDIPVDTIAPAAPSNLLIKPDGSTLTGQAEAFSTVRVYDANNQQVGYDRADSEGQFSVYFSQPYLKGQTLKVNATDLAGNISTQTSIIAPLDNTPPKTAVNVIIDELGTAVSGSAEPNSTIKVYDASGTLIASESVYCSDGMFNISLQGIYLKGQALTVTVTDRAGNVSEAVNLIAPLDNTAPDTAHDLKVVQDQYDQYVAGYAEANSIIKIYNANQQEIATGRADQFGDFRVDLNKFYLKGEVLQVKVIDRAGNESSIVSLNAPLDHTAPDAPSQITFANGYYGQTLSGQAEAYSTVRVYDSNNAQINSVSVDGQGKFTLSLYQSYLKGETLTITATDRADNVSAVRTVTAPVDNTAPDAPTNILFGNSYYGQTLSGKAEVYSSIKIYDSNNVQVGAGSTNSYGSFSIDFYGSSYLKGEVLTLTATDRAGNVSASASITAPLDNTPPDAPDSLRLVDNGYYQLLQGKAEAYSTVKLYDSANNQIGYSDTDGQGNFSTYLNKFYLHGEQLTVSATDRAGNVSASNTITAPLDNLAPGAPANIAVVNYGYYQGVTGKAEAYSSVYLYNANNSMINYGTANSQGDFSIGLYGGAAEGGVFTLIATDRAGNSSTAATLTVPLTYIPPSEPTNIVFAEGEQWQTISGRADANTYIEITGPKGYLDTAYVDSLGNFSINLYEPLYKGEVITLIARDNAGHLSKQVIITAPVDITPPNAPADLSVDYDSWLTITGHAEPYSYIKLSDQTNNNYTRDGNADAQGYFSIMWPYHDDAQEQMLTVIATDRAGNASESTAIIIPANPDAIVATTNLADDSTVLHDLLMIADADAPIWLAEDIVQPVVQDIDLDALLSQQSDPTIDDSFASLGLTTESSQPALDPEFVMLTQTLTRQSDELLNQHSVLF